MRSCPPTTPSRRTASCVDLVAGPLRPPSPLSSCCRWERREKRRSRGTVPWPPPWGGCTRDTRWRLRVLGRLLGRYSRKINQCFVADDHLSPSSPAQPLLVISLSSWMALPSPSLWRSSSCIGAPQKIGCARAERHNRVLPRMLSLAVTMISRASLVSSRRRASHPARVRFFRAKVNFSRHPAAIIVLFELSKWQRWFVPLIIHGIFNSCICQFYRFCNNSR